MKNVNKYSEPDEILLATDHDELEDEKVEEYVQDGDHVYREKEEVEGQSFGKSLFFGRVVCLLGFIAIIFVFFYKAIKLFIHSIQAALYRFSHEPTNFQVIKTLHQCFVLSKITIGLAVGFINPKWGKQLMSLFFSVNDEKCTNPFSYYKFSV